MIKSYIEYLNENLEDVKKVFKFLNILIEVFMSTFCVIAFHKYMLRASDKQTFYINIHGFPFSHTQ